MISFRCDECGGVNEVSESVRGFSIPCQLCRVPNRVPETSTSSPAPPPSSREDTPLCDHVGRWFGLHAADEPPVPLTIAGRIGLAFIALLLSFFGLMSLVLLLAYRDLSAATNWPSVQGKIVHAGVSTKVGRTSRGNRYTESSAAVVYSYHVGDREHTSSRLGFGIETTYHFLARAQADSFRVGQKVTVFYDPNRPESAVLWKSVLFGTYVMGGVGLVVAYFAIRVLLLAFMPTLSSRNSRWAPWSRRFTYSDLVMTIIGLVVAVLWVPMLFGL